LTCVLDMVCSKIPTRPRQAVMDFLANRFDVQVDVDATIDNLQRTTTQLASGLATWVLNIAHDSGVFHIESTAGSGEVGLKGGSFLARPAQMQS